MTVPEAIEVEQGSHGRKRRWARRIGWVLALLLTPLVLATVFFNSPFGKRYIADEIAAMAPASGLRFTVGRIEGDLFGKARLHDVVLLDPKGPFLTVPEIELDWRPLSWLTRGLDVRELTARRGKLSRLPELLPGDPDAPILPDFDIRVDRFVVENLALAPGVAGPAAQRADLSARADIRSGRVLLRADARLGREDRIALMVDAEPDGNRFDLALDYRAPADGVIARLTGTQAGYDASIAGKGSWKGWVGHALVRREGERFAGFRIANLAGRYSVLGQVYPAAELSGLAKRAAGARLSLAATGTLEDSRFDGRLRMVSAALDARGNGTVDLARNRFDDLAIGAILRDPSLFGGGMELVDAQANGTLDGPFRELSLTHRITVNELVLGQIAAQDLTQQGVARYDGSRWTVPLDLAAARIASGNDWLDPFLADGTLKGQLGYGAGRLESDDLALAFPDLSARLVLRGDTVRGGYALAGPVDARGVKLDGLGSASARAKILFKAGRGIAWSLRANLAGQLGPVSNSTLASLAGDPVRFRGGVGIGGNAPLQFDEVAIEAEKLSLNLVGRVEGGQTILTGQGRHAAYGPFSLEAALAQDGPRAVLVLADPLPAAGLADVRLALAPDASGEGFRVEASGGSTLGPFDGVLRLTVPEAGPSVVAIDRLKIWQTGVRGRIELANGAARGTLALAGGGLDGSIALAPRGAAQGFDLAITARQATFGGETPLSLNRAELALSGQFGAGVNRIGGTVSGQGLTYGRLFAGQFSATADIADGRGKVTARIAGQRGSRFNLQLAGDVAPGRLSLAGRGRYGGDTITMPRRAVLTREDDGGWRLEPTQLTYGAGRAVVSGRFGSGVTRVELAVVDMPLSLGDLARSDLGLGGTVSGRFEFRAAVGAAPTASVRARLTGLTRSGLILTSRPVDLALVGNLSPERLEARAVAKDGSTELGRVQARITRLPAGGTLADRLRQGALFAQLRYAGAADALWRLAAVNTFDLTGPVELAADVTGTLADPLVRGSVASSDLRVQSALSGTVINGIAARGTFVGSRLRLTRLAGTAANGGKVSGSGSFDLAPLALGRGPEIDLRLATSNARVVDANGLSATVTGPLRIVSNGVGGTIAGRLRIDRASWRLGTAAQDLEVPAIATREVNLPGDVAPPRAPGAPWRYLIDASGRNRIDVSGMGIESEWGADISLRGTTADPRLGGEARLVRGGYTFAGTRFDLTRGEIDFDASQPIDPQLDIAAETRRDALTVTVRVTGRALQPQISFSSEPPLPEEEILARLLFGGSVTSLAATDALQLGAALASLRGGGGLDPINRLRGAIGLDRLRIVAAEPALGRGTGVALGKNVTRRFYVEIVSDGRGYSATEVEFRITSWVALLGTVSTIGRNSVLVEVSRDY